MRIPIALMIASVCAMLVAAAVPLAGGERAEEETPVFPTTVFEDRLDVDPYPVTEMDERELCAGFCPDERQREAMERMADGIWRWKTADGASPWWFCGEPHDGDVALGLSKMVVLAIWEAAYEAERVVGVPVNPWGIAGTAANESSFDLCAFGLYPRLEAYERGVLPRNRRTISHTRKAVLRAINDPGLDKAFRAYDLGMLQTLDMYYDGPREDLLGWDGFRWQVQHMAQRAAYRKTDRPWMYWPGHRSEAYDRRVTRYARRFGATEDEI